MSISFFLPNSNPNLNLNASPSTYPNPNFNSDFKGYLLLFKPCLSQVTLFSSPLQLGEALLSDLKLAIDEYYKGTCYDLLIISVRNITELTIINGIF